MAVLTTIIGIILAIAFIGTIFLLTRKWGKNFFFIVLGGFGIYVLSVDAGIGIALSFIVIMTYLALKSEDLKKKR